MDYLVSDVFDAAAEWLGDSERDRATQSALAQPFQSAWGDLIRIFRNWGLPDIERPLFTVVPANSTRVQAKHLANDFSTPLLMWDRGAATSIAIQSLTSVSNVARIVTATAHGRATGDTVEVSGADPNLDGEYIVSVVSPASLDLIGSFYDGGTIAIGNIIHATEDFIGVQEIMADIPQSTTAAKHIGWWFYRNGTVHIQPSTEDREVMLLYKTSGAAPLTGYLGIDDAKDFLSHATAMYYAGPNDQPTTYEREKRIAYGTSGQPDGRGGLLLSTCRPLLLKKGQNVRRPQSFRPRREAFAGTLISA